MVMKRDKGRFVKGEHWRKPQLFRNKEWLEEHYVHRLLSAGDIAKMFSVTDSAVLFWMRKHGIKRRSVSESRKLKHWGCSGSDNPMWNRRGELNPRWLGGVTPERQAFYIGKDWKRACREVWKRDGAKCRRCGEELGNCDIPGHIHHIVSFADKTLRADVNNLILLCEVCHHFVHSKRNVQNEYLQQK
jgi:5-methylcytosine-specific restriction endonuclease McrA